jgi:hypothetical protein
LRSPAHHRLRKSIAAIGRFLEPPRLDQSRTATAEIIRLPSRRTIAPSVADARFKRALADAGRRLDRLEELLRSPGRKRWRGSLAAVQRLLLGAPQLPAVARRPHPIRPPRVEPLFDQSYPGYGIGQLKGNEILNVAPLAVGGRSGSLWFQTTTGLGPSTGSVVHCRS